MENRIKERKRLAKEVKTDMRLASLASVIFATDKRVVPG